MSDLMSDAMFKAARNLNRAWFKMHILKLQHLATLMSKHIGWLVGQLVGWLVAVVLFGRGLGWERLEVAGTGLEW